MDLPLPSREPETLGEDDQDWMSALRESVSFGRFLSESLEWDTMRHALPAPTATILHDQSLPAAGLNQDVQVNFLVPTTMVGAQSASSNCGAACIGESGAGVSCSPCLPAARPSTNIAGAALHLSMMEPMESIGQSVGSTTQVLLEDDANTNFKGSTYEPECDESLQPTIGMVFDKWEDAEIFYKHYAHEAGFCQSGRLYRSGLLYWTTTSFYI